jgi:hypothetical protein
MSSGAIEAWHTTVTPDLLETARQSIDKRHRTTSVNMELVGLYLAVKHRSKGFCNESHAQIHDGLHGVLTLDAISRALRCLDYPGLWQIVKPGGKGSPTQRVLTSFDPHGLIQSRGGQAPHDEQVTHGDIPPHDDAATYGDKSSTHGDTTHNARGYNPQQTGVSPHTPKQSPKELPKYSPQYPKAHDVQTF